VPVESSPDPFAAARPWERSERSGDRRREVVRAAVRIADADGFEAVSMRRLAEDLGVATMTPYTHVSSKDELLDLMRDEVASEMLVPEPLPSEWRPALTAIARRTKDAFRAHPWALDSLPRKPRGRINHMHHIEQSIRVVQMLGVKPPTGRAVLTSVDDYVLGYCLRAAARERMTAALEARGERSAPPEGRDPSPARRAAPEGRGGTPDGRAGTPEGRSIPFGDLDPEVAAALEAGELPLVKRLFGRVDRRHPAGIPPDSGFEPGLQWLLDGIEAEAARQATARDEGGGEA
jgi:AcrR family transcriptional regulator